MADLKLYGQTTSKQRVGNGVWTPATGTRDGALYVCEYKLAMAMEGKVFHVSHGTVSTPVTFAAYNALQPVLAVDVPTGVTIIPIKLQVFLEDSAGTDTEIIATTTTNVLGPGTSTAITPLCTRRNSSNTSGCPVYSAYSGNSAAPAGVLEFWRGGYAFADTTVGPIKFFEWDIDNYTPQVLVGPSSLVMYVSATTTQAAGFIKASWMEMASTEI